MLLLRDNEVIEEKQYFPLIGTIQGADLETQFDDDIRVPPLQLPHRISGTCCKSGTVDMFWQRSQPHGKFSCMKSYRSPAFNKKNSFVFN